MSRHNWVDDKYIKERVIIQMKVDIHYRIKKHRKELISSLKKELKGEYNNGNVVVRTLMEAANAV